MTSDSLNSDIFVFDRNVVRQNRNRASQHLKEHGFLFDWSMNQIKTRLDDIKRTFPKALQIGCRTHGLEGGEYGIKSLYTLDVANRLFPNIIADEELLPIAPQSMDLIFSPLNLHTTNDLPGTLSQIKSALKADGLFIASLLGGETLYELRSIMQKVEIEETGGISPHVAPFADMPQMGNLIQRAGFNLPVIDSEKITVTYDNVFKLFKDLRLMGEGNALMQRHKKFTSRTFFGKVAQRYAENFAENDGRIIATFEVIFLIGWSPHESQQKPLRPGSAKNRLSDALKTEEEKLPC